MSFVFFRVDDRLIHGQVIEGWVRVLDIDTIVVANNRIAEDESQKAIFEFAVPPQIKTFFLKISSVPSIISLFEKENKRVIFLFSSINDVYELVSGGFFIKELNLGGLRSVDKKKRLSPTVFLNDNEIEVLKKLLVKGVAVNIQAVPGEKPKNVKTLLDRKSFFH